MGSQMNTRWESEHRHEEEEFFKKKRERPEGREGNIRLCEASYSCCYGNRDLSSIFLGMAYIGDKVWLLSVLSSLVPFVLEKLLPVKNSQFLQNSQESNDDDDFIRGGENNGACHAQESEVDFPYHCSYNNSNDDFYDDEQNIARNSPTMEIETSAVDVDSRLQQKYTLNNIKRRVRERVEYLSSAREISIAHKDSANGEIFSAPEAVTLFWSFGQMRLEPANLFLAMLMRRRTKRKKSVHFLDTTFFGRPLQIPAAWETIYCASASPCGRDA